MYIDHPLLGLAFPVNDWNRFFNMTVLGQQGTPSVACAKWGIEARTPSLISSCQGSSSNKCHLGLGYPSCRADLHHH